MDNIFNYQLPQKDTEVFSTLLQEKNVEIKTIISNTLGTPREFCSDKDEWVVLLSGCAKIEIAGEVVKLTKGSSLFIKANTPHKVLKTKKVAHWLAVYIG